MESATLIWIDATSGEGMVELNGESLYLHFSCIVGVDKNGYAYPTEADQHRLRSLPKNAPCKVTVYENLYSRRVETCEFT